MTTTGYSRLDRARMRLIAGFVDTYLQLSREEMEVFRQEMAKVEPEQREEVMEIVTSWEREGIAKGLQQGLEQGREEGCEEGREQEREAGRRRQAALILRQLEKRLGAVEAEARERVTGLSAEELDALGIALLDFTGTGDLTAWLARLPAAGESL